MTLVRIKSDHTGPGWPKDPTPYDIERSCTEEYFRDQVRTNPAHYLQFKDWESDASIHRTVAYLYPNAYVDVNHAHTSVTLR